MKKIGIVFIWVIGCSVSPFTTMVGVPITQADITAGFVIGAGGSWELVEDVTFVNSAAITINASNVLLDLQGHSMDGLNTGDTGIAITGTRTNITIQDGTIENVVLNGINSPATVDGLIITDVNVHVAGAAGMTLQASNMVLTNCVVSESEQNGIYCNNGSFIDLESCIVRNSAGGIILDSGTQDVILNACVVSTITLTGISLSGQDMVLRQCGSASALNGCIISGSNIELLQCNFGFSTNNGIEISGDNNTLFQTSGYQSGGSGLVLEVGAANNTITEGFFTDNDGYGVEGNGDVSNVLNKIIANGNGLGNTYRIVNRE